MADLLDFAPVRVFTSNAAPGAGYIARFFQSGTTTPVTVFSDVSLNTPWGTSVTADAEGVFPAVFSSGGAIKATIETPAGAVVATIDPVQSIAGNAASAESVTFTPTPELPFTNVQAAIVGAAASAASGFAVFGLGVTGSVGLIASLNDTTTASGLYRFDATTTGAYPTGVAAADTGAVRVERETAGSAWMVLYHDTTDRVFYRRMNASTWGAWREKIIADIGATQGDILFRSATAWTRLAAGTSGQVLRTNGAGANPSWVTPTATGITLGTAVTASGVNVDFTGIPATANRVKFMLVDVSTSGVSPLMLQIGDSGGVETTGYTGVITNVQGSVTPAAFGGSGFELSATVAAATITGVVTISRITGNTWVVDAALARTDGTARYTTSVGAKTLSAALDRVRLTTVGGADTFDAGTVNVSWE
jgi:hypothetical protein